MCILGCLLLWGDPAFALDDAQTYSYDFTDGAGGWELDDNWSLSTWDPGGQALLGTNDGVAFHTEGAGTAVAEADLTAARGDQTVTATTDDTGAASVTFTFDDEDRFSAWTITGPGDAEASVDAFDASPVVMWTSRPPDRVRRGPTGRVTP
jgi:hypothetical protein